jgi:hypothetical protein
MRHNWHHGDLAEIRSISWGYTAEFKLLLTDRALHLMQVFVNKDW